MTKHQFPNWLLVLGISLVIRIWSFRLLLARLQLPDRDVLVVLELELIFDINRLFAVGVGGDGEIPAEEIGGAIVLHVAGVGAEGWRGFHERHADGFDFSLG